MKLIGCIIGLFLSIPCYAGTFWVSPSGKDSNSGLDKANALATPAAAYAKMASGSTCVFANGTYVRPLVVQANSQQIHPPAGTVAAYTILKAETFGQVVLDGQNAMAPIDMAGPAATAFQYVQFDGLVFRNQNPGAQVYGANHIKFTRCGFEGASSGNSANFAFTHGSYGLVEDCFFWGTGRYKCLAYLSDHVVFRRCVARIDSIDAGGQPIAGIVAYTCDNVAMQNCIVLDGDQPNTWTNVGEFDGAYSLPSTNGPSSNITIDSCIALNVNLQFLTLTKQLSNVTVKNCVGWHLQQGVFARDSAAFDHCTIGDVYGPDRNAASGGTTGLQFVPGDDPVNSTAITNSILTGIKGTALNGWSKSSGNIFWNNTADVAGGTTKGEGDANKDPVLKWITDSGDATHGASIRKRVGQAGTLFGESGYGDVQSTELWPFPNEAIIHTFLASTSARGFCGSGKTLTGYVWGYLGAVNPYDGVVPPPPPAKPTIAQSLAEGDSNNDGSIDLSDVVIPASNFGKAWDGTKWVIGVLNPSTGHYEVPK